jgi:hypothetical protein
MTTPYTIKKDQDFEGRKCDIISYRRYTTIYKFIDNNGIYTRENMELYSPANGLVHQIITTKIDDNVFQRTYNTHNGTLEQVKQITIDWENGIEESRITYDLNPHDYGDGEIFDMRSNPEDTKVNRKVYFSPTTGEDVGEIFSIWRQDENPNLLGQHIVLFQENTGLIAVDSTPPYDVWAEYYPDESKPYHFTVREGFAPLPDYTELSMLEEMRRRQGLNLT